MASHQKHTSQFSPFDDIINRNFTHSLVYSLFICLVYIAVAKGLFFVGVNFVLVLFLLNVFLFLFFSFFYFFVLCFVFCGFNVFL